jgi:RNA polymerase sigma factor (sigma-70 family)
MADPFPSPFLHHIRHLLGNAPEAALSDAQLLERFGARRDQCAAEVLLHRYGPLVLGVCRRVLRDAHAAEDAFQATFLVLLRKAGSLDRGKPLAGWLYTVAYRLALRARANEVRRQRCETLGLYLPRLNAKTIKDLKKRLDALPPGGSAVTATTRMAENLLGWIVGEVKEASDEESLLAFLSQLCGESRGSPENNLAKARAFLKECGGSAKGILKCAEQMRPRCPLLAKKLGAPPDEWEKVWEREVNKLAGNPVFKLFAPVLYAVRCRQAQADIRRALLSAALAVRREGKGALRKHPDPVAGGPFEYAAFKGGFELRSRWKLDEKVRARWKLDKRFAQPVTLTAGKRGK